ncbi:MAG: hypothetical protein IJ489_08775 [Clostridia bacterium]|nr:hypothetical protein [Clostridia bacterium]
MEENKNHTKKKETENEGTYSRSEVQKMIADAVAAALANVQKNNNTVRVEEYVTLMYLGNIAEGTVVTMGKLGQFYKSGDTRDIPKRDFLQNMDIRLTKMLESRQILVLSGLDDRERERYGLLYADGEVLTREQFDKILSYSDKQITEIFSLLCPEHQKMVAGKIMNAYFENHDNRITPERVKKLQSISKKTKKDGFFIPVIEAMGDDFKKD